MTFKDRILIHHLGENGTKDCRFLEAAINI